jgi:hypothetical protein
MKQLAYGAVMLALASPASATRFEFQLIPSAQQTSRMQNGVAAVDDTMAESSVRVVQPNDDVKKRSSIQILVMNQGDKPFNFGPENVTATLADGTPVAIITYEQLMHEEKNRETWRAVFAGLAAMNSGRTYGTANYSGSTFGSFGTTPYSSFSSGSATFSTYNPGAAAVQNQMIFDRLASTNAASREALKANIRTTTVDPQQMFGGTVMFELPKAARASKADVPLTFVVSIDGEQHKFAALLKRR